MRPNVYHVQNVFQSDILITLKIAQIIQNSYSQHDAHIEHMLRVYLVILIRMTLSYRRSEHYMSERKTLNAK